MRDYFYINDRDVLLFSPVPSGMLVEHVTMWTDAAGLPRWSCSFSA